MLGSRHVESHDITSDINIRSVWASNFEKEFERMLDVAAGRSRYVAFDTEYPGILQQTRKCARSEAAFAEAYGTLRVNVDLMKLIQLGLAFADENHKVLGCWQFHFHFDCSVDRCSPESLNFLADAGVDFRRHATNGLSMEAFGERLTASGLVLSDEVQWVAFHGMYDFAYMLKLLTGSPMPVSIAQFDEALDAFFPRRLDLKRHFPKGSLSHLGEKNGLRRQGTAHQGGSDALLTLQLFFCVERTRDVEEDGRLFGLHESSHSSEEDSNSGSNPCHQQILAAQRSAAVRNRGKSTWAPWGKYDHNHIGDNEWSERSGMAWISTYPGQFPMSEGQFLVSQMSSLNVGAPAFVPQSW